MVSVDQSIAACVHNKDDNTQNEDNLYGCRGIRGNIEKDLVWLNDKPISEVSKTSKGLKIGTLKVSK